jgi:hypothetical protein
MEIRMKTLNFSATALVASLLVATSAFAQSTSPQNQQAGAQKQPTQWGGQSCNVVADAKADPECAAYLRNKQGTIAPIQPTQDPVGQKQ